MGQFLYVCRQAIENPNPRVPYFPVDNARVIYTKMLSKREETTFCVIHKVRVMQLK
jgi:hypothetical protein